VCAFKKTSSKISSQGPPLERMKIVLFHYKNMYFIEYEIKEPSNYDEEFVNMDVKKQQCRMGVIPSFGIILGILWIYSHAKHL